MGQQIFVEKRIKDQRRSNRKKYTMTELDMISYSDRKVSPRTRNLRVISRTHQQYYPQTTQHKRAPNPQSPFSTITPVHRQRAFLNTSQISGRVDHNPAYATMQNNIRSPTHRLDNPMLPPRPTLLNSLISPRRVH